MLKLANQLYYKKDNDWAYYNKLNFKWGLILNNPRYLLISKNDSVFSKIGWSTNDREIFYNYWILEDSLNYSLKKMNILYKGEKNSYSQVEFGRRNFKIWVANQLWTLHLLNEKYLIKKPAYWIPNFFKEIVYFIDSYSNSFLLVFSTFLMIFFVSRGVRLYYFLSLLLLILLVVFFNATNSILFKPRILNSMMLATICLGIFHNQIKTVSEMQLSNSKYILLSLNYFLILSFSLMYIIMSSISNKKINLNQQVIWSQIEKSNPNHLILILDGSSGFSTTNFNPFHNLYNLNSQVKFYYSTWLSQSPVNKKLIKKLNSKNFFIALTEGKILIYNENKDLNIFNPVIIYFKEHFNKNIFIKAVNPQNTIYRVMEQRNN
jgi:hypothetical protein